MRVNPHSIGMRRMGTALLGRRAALVAAVSPQHRAAAAAQGSTSSTRTRPMMTSASAATAEAVAVEDLSFVVESNDHVRTTTTTKTGTMTNNQGQGQAGGVMGDRDWSRASGPRSPPPGYSSFRELPSNVAPANKFTVDDVAAADAARFELHPSVAFWAGLQTRFNSRSLTQVDSGGSGNGSEARWEALAASVRELLAPSSGLTADAESAAYWAYHASRTGFFLGASAASVLAHHLSAQLRAALGPVSGSGSGGSAPAVSPSSTPWTNLSKNAQAEVSNRLVEAVATYSQDLKAIKEGLVKMPYDMTPTLANRQLNPLFALREAARFVGTAIGTLDRRLTSADTSYWLTLPDKLYPGYYADNTFHYQDGGWMSSRSASAYDFSTEALFFGRQDAMQRTAIMAISEHLRDASAAGNTIDPSRLRIVEVGAGTGRVHTFIKDNWPQASSVLSDLSPFYLERARSNVATWRAVRGLPRDGSGDGGVEFLQAAMEDLSPLQDSSAGVVVSVYAFHEMPVEARAAALREWSRVLKPGGLVVLVDSVQLGDRPEWDATLGAFGNFNEPHYREWISCDVGAVALDATGGLLQPRRKYLSSATKALTFVKRDDEAAAREQAATREDDAAPAPAPELN